MNPRRAAAGLVLGAAGMLASRLSGRRGSGRPASHQTSEPPLDPGERGVPDQEIERARAELSEELARRSAHPDNPA